MAMIVHDANADTLLRLLMKKYVAILVLFLRAEEENTNLKIPSL
jgi:hypothetical protein